MTWDSDRLCPYAHLRRAEARSPDSDGVLCLLLPLLRPGRGAAWYATTSPLLSTTPTTIVATIGAVIISVARCASSAATLTAAPVASAAIAARL